MVPDNSVTDYTIPILIYKYNTDTSLQYRTILKIINKTTMKLQLDHSNNHHQLTATNFSNLKPSGSSKKHFYDAKYMHLHPTKFVT